MTSPLPLAGKRVAVLVEDLFEDTELTVPRDVLRHAGAEVVVIGPLAGRAYTGKHGAHVTAERAAAGTKASDFDAVVVPGVTSTLPLNAPIVRPSGL